MNNTDTSTDTNSNITSQFENYLLAAPRLAPRKTAACFLGSIYEQNEDSSSHFISILSGGAITAEFPYSFSLKPLDCYLLLYTENGCGKLHLEQSVHSLESGSLLFLNCSRPMKIEIAVSPWSYKVFFLQGSLLDVYYRYLPEQIFPLFSLLRQPSVIRNLKLLSVNNTGNHIRNKLQDFRLLNDIFTDLLLEYMEENPAKKKTPAYLLEMKELFDLNYQKNFTLDELEEHFSISKYRLCREFHACFGAPPLQYLNTKRMDAAKDLLLTTDYRIHEIGSLVGIDNTNHFITLFKKYAGMTPLVFRRA